MPYHPQGLSTGLVQAPKQKGQLSQHLMMTGQMQQALQVLQLPLLELSSYIEEQVAQNPVLEMDGEESVLEEIDERETPPNEEEKPVVISDKEIEILQHLDDEMKDLFSLSDTMPIKRTTEEDELKAHIEQSIVKLPTLLDRLEEQAHETFECDEDIAIAEVLMGYIEANGLMTTPIQEIATRHHLALEDIERVLKEMQTFEPFGVFAASTQESFLIQLRCRGKADTLAYAIVSECYDALIHNAIPVIQKMLKCPLNEIQVAIETEIAHLDLHPGMHYSSEPTQAIIPDVILKQEGETLVVSAERDFFPPLRLNSKYLALLDDKEVSVETKHFVKHNILSAKWLMRNLHQRYSTIEKLAEWLGKKQKGYFLEEDGKLVPLTMSQAAEEIGVHESTIARTVANKYIATPRGLLPLRTFFTTKYVAASGEELSSTTIKEAIAEIIVKEEKSSPLSDDKISFLLAEKGMNCARRTVAKYRGILGLGNVKQRRKYAN